MAARGAAAGTSLVKRAWHEIPEVVCSLALCGIGLTAGALGIMKWKSNPEQAHQHKFTYTVVRTSDVDPTKDIYN